MSMESPKIVTSDLVLKCQLGKHFDELRSFMNNENIDGLFNKSCFAYFIKLLEDRILRFPISKVYSLLSYKADDLMAYLENKNVPKHYREKLCLVWFVLSILLARDIRKVIEDDLLALADDFEKFNDYPLGYDSYYFTIEYLLTELYPKTITLYDLPWDFMVVHPWIVPTDQELGMTSFITLGLVYTKVEPTMELIKKELARETAIRRAVRQGQPNVEALYDQPTAIDPGASFGGIVGGVADDGGSHPDAVATSSRDYDMLDGEDKLLEKLEAITEVVEELKSKRGIIPSKKVRDLYTPTEMVRRKRRNIRQLLSILKTQKIATPPSLRVLEVQGPLKKVDIYVALGNDEKEELEKIMTNKMKPPQEYTIHSFYAKELMSMTNIREWYMDNSKLIDHLSMEALRKESWDFEG
ncbi:hypothetical protein FXO37_15267 [Capsicum annuum]|nr:hypothetical protein FXO37_15267 [Capsicum annuum]